MWCISQSGVSVHNYSKQTTRCIGSPRTKKTNQKTLATPNTNKRTQNANIDWNWLDAQEVRVTQAQRPAKTNKKAKNPKIKIGVADTLQENQQIKLISIKQI